MLLKKEKKIINHIYGLWWWREIDDIFSIWGHGEEKLRNFVETPNEFHVTIKFTAD